MELPSFRIGFCAHSSKWATPSRLSARDSQATVNLWDDVGAKICRSASPAARLGLRLPARWR